MKRRILAMVMSAIVCCSFIAGCSGNAGKQETINPSESTEVVEDFNTEIKEENEEVQENKEEQEESAVSENDDEESVSRNSLDVLGGVDVDAGLFSVTITLPQDFVSYESQEELDEVVKAKGYKSGTLNSDGSVTLVMTKEQHRELMAAVSETIDEGLADMIESEDYPNITAISANDNYTVFTITTRNEEISLGETMSVLTFYLYGGMYAVFSGEDVDNIHVDFVNEASGEIIDSADSKNLGEDDE